MDNFSTSDSIIAKLSRRVKAGITIFTGQFGLPFLPYAPKCTLVFSEPHWHAVSRKSGGKARAII